MDEIQFLRNAQKTQQNTVEVFKKLNIDVHVYTVYVYEIILFKSKDTVENILEELKFVNNSPKILEVIKRMEQTDLAEDIYSKSEWGNYKPEILYDLDGEEQYLNVWEIVRLLQEKGVQYISRFIVSYSNLINDDDY